MAENKSNAVRMVSSCRVCGNKELKPILSLGTQFVSDFVDSEKTAGILAPLELVLCAAQDGGCGLLQLHHTVSAETMYQQYWYLSSINPSMRVALQDIVLKAVQMVELNPNEIVVDIGCNDGTLFRQYPQKNIRLIGFDPAKNLEQFSKVGTTKIFVDYFNYNAFEKAFPNQKAKIITSIAMFYDLDKPNDFVSDIKKMLHPEGLWVIQMSYLPLMLEQNAFDGICHEHLEYYSLFSLENLLKRHGLKVADVETNDVNGGSFRIYIFNQDYKNGKTFPGAGERLEAMRQKEQTLGLEDPKTYLEFAERVQRLKKETVALIQREVKKGKKVFVYGASTKGNVLLQYYGLDKTMITAAAERNPDKYGKKTIGSWIPIVSEEEAHQQNPDYFLVLPWHFLSGFLIREKEYLENGGQFIVPLPELKIIGKQHLAKTQKK